MRLPEDLKAFRANPDKMSRLAVSVCVAAVVMLTITAHTRAFQDELDMERARAEANEKRAELAAHYAALVAACMNGDQFIYVDPHTGANIGVFCDVEMLGRIGR